MPRGRFKQAARLLLEKLKEMKPPERNKTRIKEGRLVEGAPGLEERMLEEGGRFKQLRNVDSDGAFNTDALRFPECSRRRSSSKGGYAETQVRKAGFH